MLHHVAGPDCPACDAKLVQAHPELADWFTKAIKPEWPFAHISWSYRNEADQEAAFAEGRTQLHFPNSAHNQTDAIGNPQSMALDLFELNAIGAAMWRPAFFAAIHARNDERKFPIDWGGKWKNLGDGDHFQLRSWRV